MKQSETTQPNTIDSPQPTMTDLTSPPTYGDEEVSLEHPSSLQILITPCAGATSFQNGYLGADNEHCSIEGEVQIKGTAGFDLDNMCAPLVHLYVRMAPLSDYHLHHLYSSIAFRTVETVDDEEVELSVSKLILFIVPQESTSSFSSIQTPSTLPFSIPLTTDIPQAVSTPTSSITHTLSVMLTPRLAGGAEAITKSTPVDITRYTAFAAPAFTTTSSSSSTSNGPSHADFLALDPVTMTIESPAHATVQIPRTMYRVGEAIPLYVTIPPPERSAVARSGLRLRNVKADLVRTVHVNSPKPSSSSLPATSDSPNERATPRALDVPLPIAGSSQTTSRFATFPPEKVPHGITHPNATEGHTSVVRRSGAACRFHSSRPIKLRLVLHDNDSNTSGTITQSTLSHEVSFHIELTISYTSAGHGHGHSSSSSVSIPVVMLPQVAPARQGDFGEDIDTAYHKKHDPPPMRTHRNTDHIEDSSELPAFDDLPPIAGSSSSITTSCTHSPGVDSRSWHIHAPLNVLGSQSSPLSPSLPPPFSEASTSYAAAPPSFEDAAENPYVHSTHQQHHVSFPPAFEGDGEGEAEDDDGAAHLPSFIESESEVQAQAQALAFNLARRDNGGPSGSHNISSSESRFGYWEFDPHSGEQALHFPGEGNLFGFAPAEEYDGISSSIMEMAGEPRRLSDGSIEGGGFDARNAADLINSADGDGGRGARAIAPPTIGAPPGIQESLAAAVSAAFAVSVGAGRRSEVENGDPLPPPPPALDDPSDLPPTIDAGVGSLSRAQQSMMERAMVEAAAVAAASVDHGDDLPPPPPPVERLANPAESIVNGGGQSPERPQQPEARPPPYGGGPPSSLPSGAAGTAGPPPYVG